MATSDSERLQSKDPSVSKMNTEFFALPGLPSLNDVGENSIVDNTFSNRDSRQMCADEDAWPPSQACIDYVNNRTANAIDESDNVLAGMLHRNTWVIPMITFSAVNVIMIVAFEIYVVCKAARNTPSRRHLFLGQMLLLGLFIGSMLGFAYAMEPTDLSCAAIRFGTGLSYTFIYASLVVKLVFLISLNTGVYLPATYQVM